jgi:hypothetical protein
VRKILDATLKFSGIETERVFGVLLEQFQQYRFEIYRELLACQKIFLHSFGSWRADGKVYYTHGLWIACIRELAFHLSFGQSRYRILVNEYIRELQNRAEKLDYNKRENIVRLGKWLAEEAAG